MDCSDQRQFLSPRSPLPAPGSPLQGPPMPDVTIRMRPNGPLVIEGPFKLIDSRGAEFEIPANKPAVALCRCGQSSKRPFCDGSHKTCGFVSDEAPTPPAVR